MDAALSKEAVYRRILVPTDGSRRTEVAAQTAIRLSKALGARLMAVHVVASPPRSKLEAWAHQDTRFGEQLVDSLERRAVLFLQTIREDALRAGVSCDCRILHGSKPHEEIVSAAIENDCDLIVMAPQRLDGETVKVLARGRVPVLVCP